MDKNSIELTLEFLKRTELKGSEVPAFNQVLAALNIELQSTVKPEIVEDVEAPEESE